jgi:hypothetical protein
MTDVTVLRAAIDNLHDEFRAPVRQSPLSKQAPSAAVHDEPAVTARGGSTAHDHVGLSGDLTKTA